MSYWSDLEFSMHILSLQAEEERRREAFKAMAEMFKRHNYDYESEYEQAETLEKKPNDLEIKKEIPISVSSPIESNCYHELVVKFTVFDSGVHDEFYCLRCRKSLPELKRSVLIRNDIKVQIESEESIPSYLDILQEEASKIYQSPSFPIEYIANYLTNYAYEIKLDDCRNRSRKG